ncbi:MAG: hypothetical protein AB1777_11275 [Bacteroidota bacterium]
MELEKFGVVEMTSKEKSEETGGWMRLVGVFVGGLVYELVTEGYQKCLDDFNAGFQSTQK